MAETREKRLTYQDVADRLVMSVSGVRKAVADGRLRAIRIGHRTVRFNPTEVEKFERRHTDAT